MKFSSAIGMEDEMEEIPWDVINLLACCMFISFTTCASEYKAQPAVLIIQMQIKLDKTIREVCCFGRFDSSAQFPIVTSNTYAPDDNLCMCSILRN